LKAGYAKDREWPVAALRNAGSSGRAGAGVGAHFIGAGVKPGQAWAHLDIAGMAWRDDGQPTVPAGAAAYGVRLLDQYVRDALAD